jgi:hypothetical protein
MLKPAFALSVLILGTRAAYADPTATPWIDQPQQNQAQRIDQGVQSGALTSRETRTLDARENRIANDEAAAKADGVVTSLLRPELMARRRLEVRDFRLRSYRFSPGRIGRCRVLQAQAVRARPGASASRGSSKPTA